LNDAASRAKMPAHFRGGGRELAEVAMPRRRTYAGFTLVELLVVIGIIALLIAILLPLTLWGRAREKGCPRAIAHTSVLRRATVRGSFRPQTPDSTVSSRRRSAFASASEHVRIASRTSASCSGSTVPIFRRPAEVR